MNRNKSPIFIDLRIKSQQIKVQQIQLTTIWYIRDLLSILVFFPQKIEAFRIAKHVNVWAILTQEGSVGELGFVLEGQEFWLNLFHGIH